MYHTRSNLLSAVALAFALVAFSGCPSTKSVVPAGTDIVVALDGSGDYRSVSEAVSAAEDGDVIYVAAGVYQEAVEIEDLRGVTLTGAGADQTIIDADQEYAAATLEGEDIELSGIAFRNAASHGVYVRDGHCRIRRCLVVGNGDRGIYFSSFSGEPTAEIDHCTIADNSVSGIYAPTDREETRVTNCIVAFNGRGIVSDKDEGNMTIEYNCVYEDGDEFDRVTEGGGNITDDPEFINRDAGDYRLAPGSPCIGQASDGGNLGCF